MSAVATRDDEAFDPKRHKVWRVDVTLSYETFVIATNADEAEEVAVAYEHEDRSQAEPSHFATEVRGPLAGPDGEVLPWGPNQWGRGELTVNQALALLVGETIPEPPSLVPPLEHLSDLDWVRKASGDGVQYALHGVARIGDNVAASDGKRLHLAPAHGMREGHWNPETGEAIPAPFPRIDHLFPAGPPNVALDLGAAWGVIREAGEKNRYVSIPSSAGTAWFDAQFLADALVGAMAESGPTTVHLLVDTPLALLRLEFPETARSALLMPVRDGLGEHGLGAFVRPIEVQP